MLLANTSRYETGLSERDHIQLRRMAETEVLFTSGGIVLENMTGKLQTETVICLILPCSLHHTYQWGSKINYIIKLIYAGL
jgi:hypothetical protein